MNGRAMNWLAMNWRTSHHTTVSLKSFNWNAVSEKNYSVYIDFMFRIKYDLQFTGCVSNIFIYYYVVRTEWRPKQVEMTRICIYCADGLPFKTSLLIKTSLYICGYSHTVTPIYQWNTSYQFHNQLSEPNSTVRQFSNKRV